MRMVVAIKEMKLGLPMPLMDDQTNRQLYVGRRAKQNICVITKSVLKLKPKMVFTDRLPSYKKLLPQKIHNTSKNNTSIIERLNLTLWTHLKRLTKKTIVIPKPLKCWMQP